MNANAIHNGRIRVSTNADFNIGDRIAYDFGNHKVVGDGKIKTVRDGYYVVRDRTTGQDLAIPKKEARATNAAEERPFTTNEVVANALEWCGVGKGTNAVPAVSEAEHHAYVKQLLDALTHGKSPATRIGRVWASVSSVHPKYKDYAEGKEIERILKDKGLLNSAVEKNGDWGNLATIYIDRAIEAEKQGNAHEAARYKEKANELMKIMRRADTGDCNVWNVRLDENDNEIKDAPAVNASTSADIQ